MCPKNLWDLRQFGRYIAWGEGGGVNIHKICIPNLEQKKIKYFNHGNQFGVSDDIYLNKQHN